MSVRGKETQQGELSGRTLGQYEISTMLGQGGMATVYLARQTSIGRTVAIKIMPASSAHDSGFIQRFEREVKVIADLQHPRVLPVHDYGQIDDRPFIVMSYIAGGTLADRIEQGSIPLDTAVELVRQMAEGLDHAHSKGVIHRDFKPGNVLIDDHNNALLADFGIARLTDLASQITGSGVVGTPAYIAPEMLDGRVATHAVDIYALGVTLYEMLTTQHPFRGNTPMSVMMAHATEPVPDVRLLRPDLPEGVTYVIQRAMAKDPASRYDSAGNMAAALADAVQGKPVTRPKPSGLPLDTINLRAFPKRRILWITAAIFVASVALFAATRGFGLLPAAPDPSDQTPALPFAPASGDEVLIIVTDFSQEGINADTRIYQALAQRVASSSLEGVRVERLEGVKPLLTNEAITIGRDYGATMVIWGTADNLSLEPHYEVIQNRQAVSVQSELGVVASDLASYTAYVTEGVSNEFEYLILYVLGQIALYRNDQEAALDLLGEAADIELGSRARELGVPRAHMLRCKALRELGRLTDALAACDAALTVDPNFEPAFHYRGLVHADMGNDEAAFVDLIRVDLSGARISETDSSGRVLRGQLLWESGEKIAALVCFNHALKAAPTPLTRPVIYSWQQFAYTDLGDTEGALAAAESAIADLNALVAAEPDNPNAWHARGYTLALFNRELDQALNDLNRAIELAEAEPGYSQTMWIYYDSRGFIFYRLGDYDTALTDLIQADELRVKANRNITHNRIIVDYHFALVYEAQGKSDEALASYMRFLDHRVRAFGVEQVVATQRIEALGGTLP